VFKRNPRENLLIRAFQKLYNKNPSKNPNLGNICHQEKKKKEKLEKPPETQNLLWKVTFGKFLMKSWKPQNKK
jgi:hypothetical protein